MVIELLTGALVVITALYAWVTYKILRANEKVVDAMYQQSTAMSRPYVVVAPLLEIDNPIFYLRITNTGKTAARNLRLSIDKSFFKFGEKEARNDIATFAVFNRPIDSLPPGAEIVLSLAQGFKVFAGGTEHPEMPQTFTVTAEYEFDGGHAAEVNKIDLRPYLGSDVPQDAYIRKLKVIADSLEKLAKSPRGAP